MLRQLWCGMVGSDERTGTAIVEAATSVRSLVKAGTRGWQDAAETFA
ncbi:unnamed protein product, partial [marine sediment metagenome]